MKKNILIIMIFTILSKSLGMIREIILSYFYGASGISDAYLISITIPSTIITIVGAAIAAGYIPLYNEIEQELGEDQSNVFTNKLLNISILFSLAIILLTLYYTEEIVYLFSSGFSESVFNLAVNFTRITIFSIITVAIANVFKGFFQIKNRFWIPAALGIPTNLIIIASIILSSYLRPVVLVYGYLIAMSSQLLLIIPNSLKYNFKYKIDVNFKDSYLKQFIYIISPIIFSVGIHDLNVIIDKTMASNIALGGISALNYGTKLNGFFQGIIIIAITTATYPIITRMATQNNIEGLKVSLFESINLIIILIIPVTVGGVVFSTEVVSLLFGRGAFDSSAVNMTSSTFLYYSIGMFPNGLKQLFTRVYYAFKDTRTPLLISIVAIVFNILLNVYFYFFTDLGVGGLALSTSIATTVSVFLMIFKLRTKINGLRLLPNLRIFIKVSIASIITLSISKLVYNYLNLISNTFNNYSVITNESIILILSISIGVLIYFPILLILNVQDVNIVFRKMKTYLLDNIEKKK